MQMVFIQHTLNKAFSLWIHLTSPSLFPSLAFPPFSPSVSPHMNTIPILTVSRLINGLLPVCESRMLSSQCPMFLGTPMLSEDAFSMFALSLLTLLNSSFMTRWGRKACCVFFVLSSSGSPDTSCPEVGESRLCCYFGSLACAREYFNASAARLVAKVCIRAVDQGSHSPRA